MVDCFKKLVEELDAETKADKKSIEDIIFELESEVQTKGVSYGDLVEREAKNFAEQAGFIERNKLLKYQNVFKAKGIADKLSTTSKGDFIKSFSDLISLIDTAREEQLGRLFAPLRKMLLDNKVADFFTQKKDAKKVSMFMHELSQDGAVPRTLESLPEADRAAYKTAQAMQATMKLIRNLKNRAGLAIANLEGRITKQYYNPDLILADKQGFINAMKKGVNWDGLLDDESSTLNKVYNGDVNVYLKALTRRIISNDFSMMWSSEDYIFQSMLKDELTGRSGKSGSRNILYSTSKSRTLDIKPEFYHDIMSTYGYGDVYDNFMKEVTQTARQLSDLKIVGTNTQDQLEKALLFFQRQNPDAVTKGNVHFAELTTLEDKIINVVGSNEVANNKILARSFSSIRKWLNAVQLGFAVPTAFVSDIAVGAYRRAFITEGGPLSKMAVFGEEMARAYKAMANQFDDATARHIAMTSREELDNLLDSYAKHAFYGDSMSLTNTTLDGRNDHTPFLKALNRVDAVHDELRKLNFLESWTKDRQAKIAPAVAADLGGYADKNFADLSKHAKEFIREVGLEDIWDTVRKRAVTNEESGIVYLGRDSLDDITDAEVQAILGKDKVTQFGIDQAREELILKFRGKFAEETKRRVLMSGVNARSILVGKSTRGTFGGEGLRNFAQYKSFAMELWWRIISPSVRRANAGDLAPGMAMMGLTIAGFVVRNWLTDIINGDTPRNFASEDPDITARNWAGVFAAAMGMPILDRIVPALVEGKPLSTYDYLAAAGPGNQFVVQTISDTLLAPVDIAKGKGEKVVRKTVQGIANAPIMGPLLYGGFQKAFTTHIMNSIYALLDEDYADRKERYMEEKGSERLGDYIESNF